MREGVINNQLLSCSVAIVEVDIPVIVTLQWSFTCITIKRVQFLRNTLQILNLIHTVSVIQVLTFVQHLSRLPTQQQRLMLKTV